MAVPQQENPLLTSDQAAFQSRSFHAPRSTTGLVQFPGHVAYSPHTKRGPYMKCAVIATLLFASSAAAQTTTATPVKPPKMSAVEATTSTVTKLEDSWAAALVRRDRAT